MIRSVNKRGMLRRFSTTSRFALMSPLNTLVLPELSFYTKLEKEQQDFLQCIASDELLTTWMPPILPQTVEASILTPFQTFLQTADEAFKETYQESVSNYSEFINSQSPKEVEENDQSASSKKQAKPVKSLIHFDIENATFDKHFHASFDGLQLVNQEALRAKLTPHEMDHTIASNSIATLSRIDFCQFSHEYLKINATRLRGRAVVKVIEEKQPSEFDLKGWIKANITSRIRNFSTINLENKLALRKSGLMGVMANEPTLEQLREILDESNKASPLFDVTDLANRFSESDFRLVEYKFCGDTHRAVAQLSESEFAHFLTLLTRINDILKNLMLKAGFISAKQFREAGNSLGRPEAAQFFDSIVALLVSKKVLRDGDALFLASEESILLKIEFVKSSFKRFSDSYLSSWLALDIKGRQNEEDLQGNNSQKQVEEIFEHIKGIYEQGSSGAKKLLMDKLKAFLKATVLPESALRAISEELERFSELSEHDSDFQNTKNYLELILQLPFGKKSRDSSELAAARKVLDDSHFGMEEVKERILQFLATGKLRGGFAGSKTLCLLGPPGVGKTSIAKAVAECLGRKFVRISLGGENDVSVLKGHRRTYLGSYPGKLVQALKSAGTENPVILLDELDKLGRGGHKGNVQDVLLEVLDPAQNHSFYDHYLELPMDLSKVLFLCSANILDGNTISAPLLDRLEVIEVSGYTKVEKEHIFHQHLLPKLRKKVGLEQHGIEVVFNQSVIDKLIDDYAREAGVRNLEKKAQTILEKLAYDFLEKNPDLGQYILQLRKYRDAVIEQKPDEIPQGFPVTYDLDQALVKKLLGPRIYYSQTIFHSKDDLIGFAFGLGYSAYGGSVLSIEVIELPNVESNKEADHHLPSFGNIMVKSEAREIESRININEEKTEIVSETTSIREIPITNGKAEGTLTVTGSLGDVMKESVEIGYSFAKHYVYRLDRNNQFLESKNLHIHFPEGASKKDGPSAGITITTALISAALQKPYDPSFAMTGEVSLNGRVLRIGGVREKVLAAKREGINQIIVPASNKPDVDELKDYVKEGMIFHFVQQYDEVFHLIFKN
jgi:ATP-dependent Lon protease